MKKKLLITLSVVACALLLVVGSIAGTIAYLTSTATVTNTFTVGNIGITLDEANTDEQGVATSGRTTSATGNTYKLIPGSTYIKDPVIHVQANSESCYLFVKIDNQLKDIETSIASQLDTNGWEKLDGATENVYYKEAAIPTSTSVQDVKVFETITINNTVKNEALAAYSGKTIVVTAYAVQSANFNNAPEAAVAFAADFGLPTT